MAIFDLELNDLASPLRMIKAESQKMGMPVMNPVMPRALELLFSPVFDKMNLAILSVAPVLSSVIPIIAPRMIRKPMEAIVFPNPVLSVVTIVLTGRVVKARKRETRKRATKAFSFILEVRIIIATMLIPTSTDVVRTSIYKVFMRRTGTREI